MGWDDDFAAAFLKAQIAGGTKLPTQGTVFISLKNGDKPEIVESAKSLVSMGFKLLATEGTATFLNEQDIAVERVNKVLEGQPHIVDEMITGNVQLVFNTTEGAQSLKDSADIRKTAVSRGIPYFTTLAASNASVQAINVLKTKQLSVAVSYTHLTLPTILLV